MKSWASDFYAKQAKWSGIYWGAVEEWHRHKAIKVAAAVGAPPKRILELGAGGGQNAVALAEAGYEVFAVEQEPLLVEHMQGLIEQHPQTQIEAIEADFYQVSLPEEEFDAVCYWDGFGIGTDEEQRTLLRRIHQWLRPNGIALIDVYTPWHAVKSVGYGAQIGKTRREYSFDAENCRWKDRWWLEETGESIEQSLRCYSPADLKLLCEGTGLELLSVESCGMFDYEDGKFVESAPLEQAMWYVAYLQPLV